MGEISANNKIVTKNLKKEKSLAWKTFLHDLHLNDG